ncbi:MAG: hypothetical protein ACJA0X_000573 [Cyclobacteriaceae bacterium]|jgi:hypothetical protein
MIENDALKYFIHEELFLVKENSSLPIMIKEANQLVGTASESSLVVEEPRTPVTPLAEKEHHDLVILLEKEQTAEDKAMLLKMIPAIGKSYESAKFILSNRLEMITYNNLIAFGEFSSLTALNQLILNESIETGNRKTIKTLSIHSLHSDVQAKGRFWIGLKKMFNIN